MCTEIKKCSKCKEVKQFSDFHKSVSGKFGLHHYCKKCNSNQKKNSYKYDINKQILNSYGKSYDFILNIYNEQDGFCGICGKYFNASEISKRRGLHIDHCHKSGLIRGLLCGNCNSSIGKFKDDINLLKNAIIYIEKHKQ